MNYLVERDHFSQEVEAQHWDRGYDLAASLLLKCKTYRLSARNPGFWDGEEEDILNMLRAFPDPKLHPKPPPNTRGPYILRPKPLSRMTLDENTPNAIQAALATLPDPPGGGRTPLTPALLWRAAGCCG